MYTKVLTSLGIIGFFTLLLLTAYVPDASGHYEPILREETIAGAAFSAGSGHDFVVTADGLTMANTAFTTLYTSPEITAPIPFNVFVPQWEATLPEGSALELSVRTRRGDGDWSEWFPIHADNDNTLPDATRQVGEMIAVPAADETHTAVQYTLTLTRDNSLLTPVLHSMILTYIDATAGPSTEEMLAMQEARDAAAGRAGGQAADGFPRPTVISRDIWCISVDCDYTAGLNYAPATHMVVHHTVSKNSSSDWAAVVRAIWSFHTYSNDWGDIGYNYLIDQNGVIYEGHMNQDYQNLDVVGTHASGANTGSMGVSLIGTFTAVDYPSLPGIQPPQAMQNSLIALLSWKADQRDINVYEASDALPYVDWGLPHLMGHRDVYGTTECPGDQAYALLPALRDAVAANLGLTNPYLVVDERSQYFTRSNTNWYEGPNECGTNGHAYYTWSTTNPASSTNWGEWRPPVTENGRYRIEVRVPYCRTGRSETDGATYTIRHADGEDTVIVSHEDQLGLWITLGEYNLEAGGDHVIRLTDLTTTDSGLGIWFDDMRLLRLEPSAANVSPTDGAWLNQRNVTFNWELSDSSAVQTTTVRVAADDTFAAPIWSQQWAGQKLTATHTFTEDAASLTWQAAFTLTGSGELISSPPTTFGIDTAVPTATVTGLYRLPGDRFLLTWSGSDALSGVADFDLAYRVISDTTWTPWISSTQQTAVSFTPPNPAEMYEFRLQATDVAGNHLQKTEPDISTAAAIDMPHAIMLPVITRP